MNMGSLVVVAILVVMVEVVMMGLTMMMVLTMIIITIRMIGMRLFVVDCHENVESPAAHRQVRRRRGTTRTTATATTTTTIDLRRVPEVSAALWTPPESPRRNGRADMGGGIACNTTPLGPSVELPVGPRSG